MTNSAHVGPSKHRTLVFPTRQAAEAAYRELLASGVKPSALSLFVHAQPSGPTRTDAAVDDATEVGGAAGAALTAAAAGGVGGALVGLGLLTIPGIGPMLAVGPIAAAITGAITGGAVGGFAGSLTGFGVSEAEAALAEKHLAAGRALIFVDRGAYDENVAKAARSGGALDEET